MGPGKAFPKVIALIELFEMFPDHRVAGAWFEEALCGAGDSSGRRAVRWASNWTTAFMTPPHPQVPPRP